VYVLRVVIMYVYVCPCSRDLNESSIKVTNDPIDHSTRVPDLLICTVYTMCSQHMDIGYEKDRRAYR